MSLVYAPKLGVPAVRLLFLGLRTEFGTAAELATRARIHRRLHSLGSTARPRLGCLPSFSSSRLFP